MLILGDLNSDFLRRSSHVETVKNFIEEMNLYSLWDDYTVDFTYLFERENGDFHSSTIDHILTLKRAQSKIVNAGALHLVENMSDHAPIYAKVMFDINLEVDPSTSKAVSTAPKP